MTLTAAGPSPITGVTFVGSGVYRLDEDLFCRDLTLETGVTLRTDDHRIFVARDFNMAASSYIENNGGDASGQTAGSSPASLFSWYATGAGRSGAAGGDASGSDGDDGDVGYFGGAGGGGGDAAGNNGGDGGARFTQGPRAWNFDVYQTGRAGTTQQQRAAGGGGGGGAQGGGAVGGGGGGGGGIVFVCAFNPVTFEGTIRANGGDGADAASGDAGGGGGGGGGLVVFASRRPIPSDANGEFLVSGGDAGAGNGTGVAGTAGEDGYVAQLRI